MTTDVKEAWFSYILPSGEWDRIYWQLTPQTLKFFYEEGNVKDNKPMCSITRGKGMFEVQLCPDHQFGRDGVFILSWGGHSDRTSSGNDKHGYFVLSATPEEMDDFLDELCTVDDFGKRAITKDVKLIDDQRNNKNVPIEPNALRNGNNQHPALGPKKHMDWDSLAMKEAAEGLGFLVFSALCYYGHDDEKGPFKYRYSMFRDWAIELYPDQEHTLEREMTNLIHLVGANLFNLGTYICKGNGKFQLNTEYPLPTSPLPNDLQRRLPDGRIDANYTVFHLQPTQGKRINHYFIAQTSQPQQLNKWVNAFKECVRFIPTPPQSPRIAPEPERVTTMELNRSLEIMSTIHNQARKDYLEDRLVDEIDYIIATENYVSAKQKIDILRMDLNLPPANLSNTTVGSKQGNKQSITRTSVLPSTTSFKQRLQKIQDDDDDDNDLPPPPPLQMHPFSTQELTENDNEETPPPPPPPLDDILDESVTPLHTALSNAPSQHNDSKEFSTSRSQISEPSTPLFQSTQTPQHDYIIGSLTSNTKGGNAIKSAVSKKKRRFKMGSYDLDLTYITDRIIAMGFPSVGSEAIYRNDIRDVTRFFENRHPNHYKIYNLCSERLYPKSSFPRVLHFPFDDHNPPCFQDLIFIVRDLTRWLRAHPENIAGIHCKAGKGRTGLIICILMLYIGMFIDVRNSLRYYASVRTQNAKGVTIPSQLRYVYMFQTYSVMAQKKQLQEQIKLMVDSGQPPPPSTPSSPSNTTNNSPHASFGGSTPTNSSSSNNSARMSYLSNGVAIDPLQKTEIPADAAPFPELKKAYQDLQIAEETLFLARAKTEEIRVQQKIIHEELPTRLPAARFLQIKSLTIRGENAPSFDSFTIFNRGKTFSTKELKPIVTQSKGIVADKNATSTPEELQQAQYYASLTPEQKLQEDFFAKSKNLYKHSRYPGDGHADFLKIMPGPTTTYTFSDGQLPVMADFNVEFHKSGILGKKRIFAFWLHTQFVEMGGLKVTMNKDFLDKANKAGGKDFQCEIILEPCDEKYIPATRT